MLAEAITPEIVTILSQLMGGEYIGTLTLLDNYKADLAATGPQSGAAPAIPGMTAGAAPPFPPQRAALPGVPRPTSRLSRVTA